MAYLTVFTAIGFVVWFGYTKAFAIVLHNSGQGGNDAAEDDVSALNSKLQSKRSEIDELQAQAEKYRKNIHAKRNEAFSLKNELDLFDIQIAKAKVEVKAKEQEIELTKIDIEESDQKIDQLTKKIARQKERIAQLLRTIYQNSEYSELEILLLNNSFSEFFNQIKYVEDLHGGLHQQLQEFKDDNAKLEEERVLLKEKKAKLEEQKQTFIAKRDVLEEQELSKSQLLAATQNSEKKFRNLLSDLKGEQSAIDAEIVSLEKNLRKKLEEQERAKNLASISGEKMIWPVPKNTITAYFHDPNYPYRYVFEHPAIDIRASQGTTVKAAASGYVAKASKDSKCTGAYAYVMIIHADGFSTVYGHLNKIDINEGDFVTQGQRIGLSGAMPGTCGAGRLTTGPHMHFEVRLNGIPVDPLPYLP
jgi:murein DD-endopeptidase MepM/ murein hydrolase activator NlpD